MYRQTPKGLGNIGIDDEDEERTALMERLRTLLSKDTADGFVGAPIEDLRYAVQGYKDQLERYRRLGLKDESQAA